MLFASVCMKQIPLKSVQPIILQIKMGFKIS